MRRVSTPRIDLHGKKRYEAVQALNDALDSVGADQLLVITGRGRHSVGGKPVVRPLVDAFLNRNGYWHRWHSYPGSGAVTVELK